MMERGEPTFVPEWYKASSGSGGSNHHNRVSNNNNNNSLAGGSRAKQSGEYISGPPSRNRPNACNHDAPRFADRGSSSFRRSSSSNGYVSHDNVASANSRTCSSFSRSHRDVDRGTGLELRDRSRSLLPDDELYDSFKSIRVETDTLRRSHSMISGQQVDSWTRGLGKDLNNGAKSGGSVTRSIGKASFERDFPSLGADDKQGPDLSKVTSPGPSSALHGLPITASAITGGNGWTSALAVVPVKVGGNGPVPHSAMQTSPVSLSSTTVSTPTGLNMAEALVQAPPRARNNPQLLVDTQSEELALKQYTKLIPVTPSTSKSMILNSSDKAKSKAKGGDVTALAKVRQQSSSQLVNKTLVTPTRAGIPKTTQAGNFQVLNRERNGILPVAKDDPNLKNATRVVTPLSGAPSAAVPLKIPNDPKANAGSKRCILTSTQSVFGEKRPQAQNRSDFFNSIRKKSSANQSTATEISCIPPSSSGEASQQSNGISSCINQGDDSASSPGLDCSLVNGNDVNRVHGACQKPEKHVPDNTDNSSSLESDDELDEKDTAFMRSLGWPGNAGEGALTTEEIDNFIKKHGDIPMKRGYRNPRPLETNASVGINCGAGSLSASISSDSEQEV